MLLEYLKRLLSKNIVITFFVIDSLGFLFLGRQLPWYAYPLSLLGGFLIGGYLVFTEISMEIERIRKATPHLALFFNSKISTSKSIVATVYKPLAEPNFETAISNKREELIKKWEDYEAPSIPESDNLFVRMSRPDRGVYEASVEAYLREYRAYLEALMQFNLTDAVIRPFFILLQNNGTVPAEKVTVEISLPFAHLLPSDEEIMWHFFDRDEMPSTPEEPDPSKGSIHALASSLSSIGNIAALSPYVGLQDNDQISNTHGPDYNYDRHLISYHVNEIIHNLSEDDFDPFLLSFSEIEENTKLFLPVKIHAANLPEPVDDLLEITIQMSSTEPDPLLNAYQPLP